MEYHATSTARIMLWLIVTRERLGNVSVYLSTGSLTFHPPLAKKSDSVGEGAEESEIYGHHGDSLLRERLQRAEEVC